MPDDRERLLAQLVRIRELSGLSLRALAGQAGLSSSSLSRYLTGQLMPPWDAVVALCKVVGRDPRPLRAVWSEAAKAGAAPAPRRNDLPADLIDFTGRAAEAARVEELLRTANAVAIDGMPGVGKTSLATHVAHRLAPSFPDGGLFLDLHGFTPGQEPLDATAALGRLLSALGIAQPPADRAERAALWRSELSRRRVLVVLDNAADAEHVRPLLPGAGKSAVLITSRNRLLSLDGVPPVSLDLLSDQDSASLFGRAAGIELAADDAVGHVLRQCGGLPLALRMAGARLRHRPGWTVAVLAERLQDGGGRFDAAFDMSLRQLDSAQRRMFRLLGIPPGSDFAADAVAALTGLALGAARAVLDELVDAHLVQEPTPGRYRLHDLLREHAARVAAEEEPRAEEALRRLFDHYVKQAAAHDLVLPFLHRREVVVGDQARALAWFDMEYTNLVACVDAAVRLGADAVAVELPRAMRAWFFRRRGADDEVRLLELAVAAAQRLGRADDRAALLVDLGFARYGTGHLADALVAYEAAEQSHVDDDEIAGRLALCLGYVRQDQGDLHSAQSCFRRAGQLFEKTGHHAGLSQALAFDGWVTLHLGDKTEAVRLARQSLAHADGPPQIAGLVTIGFGLAETEPAEALAALQQALQQAEADDHLHNQAWCHNYLGVGLRLMGDHDQALGHHRRAFEIIGMLGEPSWEIDLLHTYAETCRAAGQHDEALLLHDRTIELARKFGRPHDEQLAAEAREVTLASVTAVR